MNINGNNVDIFYDLIDEACMKLYEDIHLDYFVAHTVYVALGTLGQGLTIVR